MKILLLILLSLLISCGRNSGINYGGIRPNVANDSSFDSYKSYFTNIIRAQSNNPNFAIGDIPIVFSNDLPNTTLGECWYYSNGNMIKINAYTWGYASELRKRILINHELGHCRLGRDHNDSKYQGTPLSLMSTYILSDSYYQRYPSHYNYELTYNETSRFITYLKGLAGL